MILKREFRNIPRHYNLLISMTNQHYFVGIVNEWIVDNYYLTLVMRGLIEVAYSKRENRKYLKESSFVNQAVLSILEKHNYKIDQKMLIKDLNKIQKENDYYFSYQELELLPVITHINLIKKINEIALKEADDIRIRKRVKRLIAVIKRNLKYKRETNFKWHFNLKDPLTKYEIVYLNEQLRDLNENSNKVFKELNTFLNENNILLRNVIEEVHIENVRRNITIANVFNSVNRVNDIEDEKTYDGLSKLERLFEKDSWFEKMDTQSKILYREKLVKYCKKKKLDPYVYLNKLINKGGHIGEYLFKEKNVRIRTYIYIFILSSITLVLSYFLSSLLTNYIILGTILLLIPVSEVVNYFLKKIYLLIYKAKPLFKLDFNRGVPKEYKTMIVIPTIVKDAKKVRKVFEKLESFYLCNKSNNLYFTLLADCSESKTEHCEHDKEVVKEGLKVSFLLNKKYGKDIFYFVYRNRKFNKGENSWLGFERKRGALLDFNDLIMGNLSSEEIEDKFNINTFKKFKEKIKYVITLDVDTNLFLNSALKLIGTMAHPMNVAHLNKQKNVVTKGYGMLQPKICVDIDSTNKSMFSQIYAGIGGFDPYSNFFPDFYQDVFDEGHFVGKGIYDLEIFQHVLKNRFPNNLILSHDLIEGSYLKCGNVLDIELIDDFPSKFLVDATRRSRWARGDFQIINWVRKNVRNVKNERVKNPISPLARFKIFSNITRGLLEFNLLLIIFLSFIINKVSPVYSLLFVLFVGLIPTFSYIREKLMFKDFSLTTIKYYNVISTGGKALLLRTISFFANIPYNAKLYLTSFSKSFFRMFISKKKLLNWMTAEEAEKVVKTTFKNHIKNFKFNYISAILLMILVIKFGKYIYIGIFISLLFLFAPILAYLLSGDIKKIGAKDCEEDNKKVLEIAKKTWKFFEDNLTHETNYLIPDNYQLNREVKEDIKTSPTNIGLSLVSVVSAYELKLISKQEMIRLVKKIIATIKKLDKWFGHLYNWYNIKTLKVMYPHFLSSVDSGNFVASLIVAKEALVKLNLKTVKPIISDINKLIDETDFSKLYSESGLFSIGYNVDEGKLLPYNYNKFMSESRITSFVAIAKGDVPSKHWLYLDKTLTKYKHKKGLASWSGTAFEYFMPIIFMRSYPNTLLDESYYFAFYVQKEFMKRLNLDYPWGISESAYNELDDANSYKYGAFGIPYLRFRNEPISRVVISPYSSVLAITEFPEDVIKNLKGLLDLNMLGDYGFYDAYDITDKTPVYSYYAHHQGMILSSITNYLKNGIIQDYFEADKNIRAFIALSKERVQLKPSINYQIIKYKKYTYDKESFINDIRVFRHLSTLPEISILSNSKYSLMINDRGNSYSRYRNIQINRYRKVTEQDYGMFLYIRDKKSNKVWSNTFAPVNKTPDNYEVVFALDRIKFIRLDEKIITKTEIVVTKTHHAEIRKVTFKNLSNKTRFLELTTYNEPILFENANDISHPAFAKLFISTEYDSETNTIIAMRKLRDSDTKYYMANRLIIENPTDKYQYETNRMEFIGRNKTLANPKAINEKLTNYVGTPLDPIISLRNTIKLLAGEETTVYFVSGFGKSKAQVMDIINTYCDEESIEELGFEVATIMSNVTNKMVNITGNDMRLYNTILNYLFQTSRIFINDEHKEILKNNKMTQKNLWKFGVSGDLPIVLLELHTISNLSLCKEVLRAFEYYKSKSVFIDLVIINCEAKDDAMIMSKEIEDEKYHMYALNSFNKTPGSIFVVDNNLIVEEEKMLLRMVSRLKLDSDKYNSLQGFIYDLQSLNTVSHRVKNEIVDSLKLEYNEPLKLENKYGGFTNNGKEYVIKDNNTPLAWSNVMANKNFGTIVTNNGCGFTYALNSREFKLTSWTNDPLLSDLSEGIKINNRNINFNITKFGFGYSEFLGNIEDLDISLTHFVAKEDMNKFYYLKIKNNKSEQQTIDLRYWINPVLGVTEEKTGRYILCDYDSNNNIVTMQNVYNDIFGNNLVYMTSTEAISEVDINRILFKEIETEITLEPNEEKELSFILGVTDKENIDIKYKDIYSIKEELNNVKNNWKDILETIQIKTPDASFDYMANGWLLYQTLNSRIYSKSGFYQVGGAFGFRDQLQDSMNICTINPEITKNQIISNAKHQFVEGDVLHWWHEDLKVGLRSLYKDDYLWLIYAVSEYVNITNDYSILDERISFVEGPPLYGEEKEKGITFTYSDKQASLYEHCYLAINKSMKELGKNGLPLMGGGDWNDGMNKIGEDGKGTSVWLGFFLYEMINKFADILKIYKPSEDLERYNKFNEKLKHSIRENAWDKDYYVRAFFDNGDVIGSSKNEECKIDLLSQSYAILSGIATKEQIESIVKSVEDNLVDRKEKMIKLLAPAFEKTKDNPGYIMGYPKGIRENGGQYTHAVSWYILAMLKLGEYDKAFEYYQMINPISHSDIDKYKVEPYVIVADIYSNKDFLGRGGWSWYTGSAGWFYKIAIVDIVGFHINGNKLYIEPQVPSDWKNFNITYKYKNTTYNIDVLLNRGNNKIFVDNKEVKEIILVDDNKIHNVTIERK